MSLIPPGNIALTVLGLGLAMLCTAVSAFAQRPDGCPDGTVVIDETETHWKCKRVSSAVKSEIDAIDARLNALKPQIEQDRLALANWQKQLPGYLDALKEWQERSDHAVHEAMFEGVTLLTAGLLKLGAHRQEGAILLKRAEAEEIQRAWMNDILNADLVKRLRGNEAQLVLQIRKLQGTEELYRGSEDLRKILVTDKLIRSDAAAVEKAVKGVLTTLEILGRNPEYAGRIGFLAKASPVFTLADVSINYAYAASAYAMSWRRIDQLVNVRQLEAATSLARTHKQHVDEQSTLRQKRRELLQGR